MKQFRYILEVKLGTWFIACAMAGCVIGSFHDPARTVRGNRPTSQRYASGSMRNLKLRLRRRS